MAFGEMNPLRGNPESNFIKAEEAGIQAMKAMGVLPPFEVRSGKVPENVVKQDFKDLKLKTRLVFYKYPTDEETCKIIGEENDISAERVAAVSKYHKALMAEARGERLN